MKPFTIFVVSDSVGETGEQVVKACISQFRPTFENIVIRRFPHVYSDDQIESIVNIAKEHNAFIAFTLVERSKRQLLTQLCEQNEVEGLDLLGPMMDLFEQKMEAKPLEEPGLVHQLDDDYFKKIEAVEFAVKYDDGRDPRGLLKADVVLIGVSRTSKTPLSQYLAHKMLKVANVPIVPEIDPPEELFSVPKNKLFGLVISPEKLNIIRKERLIALGLNDDAMYANKLRIEQEIDYFYKVVKRLDCQVVDVTNKAVEETANDILARIYQKKDI